MTEERDALRTEVEQLRRQLESIRESHATDTSQLRTELEESEAARDRAEDQYQTLLGRVEKIKETLGDRLKRDREELAEAKDRVEELEGQSEGLVKRAEEAEAEAERLREELHESNRELTSLRSRGNLSQQNWLKEKEDMARQLHSYKVELDRTSSAMGEWEVIAMEQKSVRDSLADKVAELEAEAGQLREAHERAASERDAQAQAVDALQRALREIQEARKRELREVVETSEEQLEAANRKAKEAARLADEAVAAREQLSKELERMVPFEKEVKEKNLLIGKLRHEAIVLNDHLTKALKYIKKNKPEENVDRYVNCNLSHQVRPLVWLCTNNPSTNTIQASRHQPFPPVPGPRPLGSQKIPSITGHIRHSQLERGTKGAGRSREARHVQQQPTAAVGTLPPHAEHAVAQHRVLQ